MVLKLIFVTLAGLFLVGCTGQGLSPHPTEDSSGDPAIQARFENWSDTTPPYRIGEGDKLRVMFPLTPELDEDVVVRPDGEVTLRAAGDVSLANLTVSEASAEVARRATERLRQPKAMIAVEDAVSARIFVGGQVKNPGVQRVLGPMTVTEALQLASGTDETARLDEIILIRRAADGRPMLRLVDARGFLEGRAVDNPRVFPGDILYVPRTHIAELDLWIDQFINRVVPFQRTFDYTLTHGSTTTTTPP